jgi:ankyrin repeat protein
MSEVDFRTHVEQGDVAAVRQALRGEPALANRSIAWFLNQHNESDPLHYVADCVGHAWLADERAAELAAVLLEHGAAIDGSPGRETPLIGAASQGAERVAAVLIDAGAALEPAALFGARALHWAAWLGLRATARRLVERGAALEPRCTQFGATPLFWAVHGMGPRGPSQRGDSAGVVRLLVEAGADPATANNHGQTALELARSFGAHEIAELLARGIG